VFRSPAAHQLNIPQKILRQQQLIKPVVRFPALCVYHLLDSLEGGSCATVDNRSCNAFKDDVRTLISTCPTALARSCRSSSASAACRSCSATDALRCVTTGFELPAQCVRRVIVARFFAVLQFFYQLCRVRLSRHCCSRRSSCPRRVSLSVCSFSWAMSFSCSVSASVPMRDGTDQTA